MCGRLGVGAKVVDGVDDWLSRENLYIDVVKCVGNVVAKGKRRVSDNGKFFCFSFAS